MATTATALVLAAAGCGGPQVALRAEPSVICTGQTARLTWTASSGGTLTATPAAAADTGPVDKDGTKQVSPAQTTTYRLTVKEWLKERASEASVTVLAPAAPPVTIGQSIADPSAGCDATSLWVTVDVAPTLWDPTVKVGQVSSTDGRAYHLEHEGITADVVAGAPSAAFQGKAIAGAWKLTTTLQPGEACGHKVPRNLVVGVASSCGP